MIINTNSVGFPATEAMLKYLTDKLTGIEKFKEDGVIEVSFSKEGTNKKVTMMTFVKNKRVEVNATNKDFYHAIDLAYYSLKEVIAKEKAKAIDKKRRMPRSSKQCEFDKQSSEDNQIVKRKTVSNKPMSEKEAVLQMNAFNYNSFLFYNVDTKTPCMLYKKNDKQYVLIDTDVVIEENINYVI